MNKEIEEEVEVVDTEEQAEEQPQEEKEVKVVSIASDELEELKDELSSWKNKYFLALAETENSRKRQQKERKDMTRFALENVIIDVLKPLDDLKRALKFTDTASTEVQNWAMGFNMIVQQFGEVLATHNIKGFSSLGEQFDPHLHEAVEAIEDLDQPNGMIVEEVCCGYKAGDRVIRAAQVKVIKHPEPAAEEKQEETSPAGEEQS